MQSLEIISVNLWQILISLCNLLIIFLILKKFLYGPVRKVLSERQAAVDEQYARAEAAEAGAAELKAQWEEKISGAEEKAQSILQDASANAERRRAAILDETHAEADRIIRQAESDAELERKKAKAGIRQEIVDVSAALSEKLLGREITADDHRNLIDSFLSEIGEGDGTGK